MPKRARRIACAGLAAAASLAAAQPATVVQGMECRGDEPAWRLDAKTTSAVYSSIGPRGKREVVFRGSLQSISFLTPPVVVWRGDSTHLPRETLVVSLREEACPSTMADAPAQTHRAILSLRPGEALTGCCTLRVGAPPAPPPPPKRAP